MTNYPIKKLLAILFLFFITSTACSKEEGVIEENQEINTDSSTDNNDGDGNSNDNNNNVKMEKIILTVGNTNLEVELVENSSVDALVKVLKQSPITVNMSDYGNMEKVGSLGQSFPRNDTQITTEAGDVILYQGNMLVIYYAPNSWSFTRLGKIKNVTTQSLKNTLGDGNVTVVVSLPSE